MSTKFWASGSSSDSGSDPGGVDDYEEESRAYILPSASERWSDTTKLLGAFIATGTQLLEVCMRLNTLAEEFERVIPSVRPVALDAAIEDMGEETFYKVVLPGMQRCAMETESLFPAGTLQRLAHHDKSLMTLSRAQVRCIMCHAFFCNLSPSEWRASRANLNMRELFVAPASDIIAVERLKCLLCYFYTTSEEHDLANISFQRNHAPAGTVPTWSDMDTPICACAVSSKLRIEDVKAARIVDFANANLHIGRIIASCTQEEILFSICPELMPSMLICEQMEDDEAIIICNARQFSEYNGYRDGFRFVGPVLGVPRCQDVIAMDALPNVGSMQFMPECMERDIGKAFAGFSAPGWNMPNISTGAWGCGVFGGSDTLKFCQQLIAASACYRGNGGALQLHYSTYGDEGLEQCLTKLWQTMSKKGVTVGKLWKLLMRYDTFEDFGKFLDRELRSM